MSDEASVPGTEDVAKGTEKPSAKVGVKSRLRLIERGLFGVCGALLLIGFFLPWFAAGAVISISGLGLVFASGEVVGMLSGSNRFLLIAVPVLGVLLLGGSILGHRVTRWLAVGGSGVLLLFGLFLLVRMFISTTGLGMWLVILSALLALSVGLLSVGRISRSSDSSNK
jgi:hypothetical protein